MSSSLVCLLWKEALPCFTCYFLLPAGFKHLGLWLLHQARAEYEAGAKEISDAMAVSRLIGQVGCSECSSWDNMMQLKMLGYQIPRSQDPCESAVGGRTWHSRALGTLDVL